MNKPTGQRSPPLALALERTMQASPEVLYRAWTENIDQWFAAPGTVLMKPKINVPFYFETHFEGQSHPHYGRFLQLVPHQLVELTWVTGNPGTGGAETILRIELDPLASGTRLRLLHSGFADEEAMRGHEAAWPLGLDLLDERMA